MLPRLVLLLFLSSLTQSQECLPECYAPEQVHIAFGDPEDPTQMLVVWSTVNETETSTVHYFPAGSPDMDMTAEGVSREFVDQGEEKRVQYIHRVKVTGLTPGQKYQYKCGSPQGWSDMFSFTAMKDGSDWSPRFAVFGDMGIRNARALPLLKQETEQGMYDAMLHVGDFGYDMYVRNGRVGDEFLNLIQPIAANVPYMTCPGNHEVMYNFSNYRHQFVMPGDELGDKMFYSLNIGPVHLVSLSTEYYFYPQYGFSQPIEQYRWLRRDLKKANRPKNRAKRPWIITMGHRPMYCSNDNFDCRGGAGFIRTGYPFLSFIALEKLFYDNGVDLMIWAHQHSYERLWPVYDETVYNGSTAEPYTNPGAPVHIITGSAGCIERIDSFSKHAPYYSAFRSGDYGHTRMTVHNKTHLYIEQVSDEKDGEIIDSMWLQKDSHTYPERD